MDRKKVNTRRQFIKKTTAVGVGISIAPQLIAKSNTMENNAIVISTWKHGIEANKVAEAYSKVMTADFVFSVSRKVEDKIANTGRVHIIKNRFGPDGLPFPASINTNNGKIEVFESGTVGGKEAQGKMDNKNEFVRKMLKNKSINMQK